MKLSAPTKGIWLIAIILGALGVIGQFVDLGSISQYRFWLVTAGFGLLAIGTSFRNI